MNLKTSLYKHQEAAFNKLKDIKACALFMDTGTGKTRTVLEFIKYRLDKNKVDRAIWVCPVSTKKNLLCDINKHSYNCSVSYIEKFNQELICIVGLETISNSDRYYSKLRNIITDKTMMIIDESHMIKNHKAKRTCRLLSFQSETQYRVVMTGTPVTQGIWDLFTQIKFLHPKILGYNSFYSFANNHLEYSDKFPGMIVRAHNQDYLTRKINPYVYQIKKEECLDLPEKNYQNRYFYMSQEHLDYYNFVKDLMFNNINWESLESTDIFKMICYLHRVASGYIETEYESNEYDLETKEFKKYKLSFKSKDRADELLSILESINFNKDKCIIWYRYNSDLELIKSVLTNYRYSVFNGVIGQKERDRQLDLFLNKDINILIANINSGSTGLNLQMANYMIFYNNTFDYARRYQSEDRIYRIGQNKNCHIFDIIANGTIDERIMESLENKESLAESIKNKINTIKDNEELINKFKEEILNEW